MRFIQNTDYNLLYYINSFFANDFFDFICPLFRNKYFWIPLYVFIITFLIINFKKKGIIIILILILAVIISDQLSSQVIKPFVQRLRPCNDPFVSHFVRTIIGCKSGFSFPSSHASNHFTIGILAGLIFIRHSKWVLAAGILWAFVISYSQIYIGVHYPSDIIAGAFLAFSIATIMFSLWQFFLKKSGIE